MGYSTLKQLSGIVPENVFVDNITQALRNELAVKLSNIKEQLDKLSIRRSKRGLVNALGTVVKFITGNPDDSDLQTIRSNIEQLHKNQGNEIVKINQLTSFANHVSKRLINQTETLNRNIEKTRHFLHGMYDTLNYRILIENQIHQSELLANTLFALERTISLALYQVPNLEILTVNDIFDMSSYLTNIYSRTQLFPFDENHIFKFIESTKLLIFNTNETVTFLFKVPVLKPFSAHYSRIYPVPNHLNILLVPPKQYLVQTSNAEFWTDEDCQPTTSFRLCLKQPTQELCSISTLEQCKTAKAVNNYEIAYPLANNELLLMSQHSHELIEDCNGVLSRHQLQKASLVRSPCRIIFGTFSFFNSTPIYEIKLPSISVNVTSFSHHVELQLQHLTSSQDLHKASIPLPDPGTYVGELTHYSVTFLCFICLFAFAILLVCYRQRLVEIFCKPRTIIHVRPVDNNQPPILDEGVQKA